MNTGAWKAGQGAHLVEEVADAVRVARLVDVPDGAGHLAVLLDAIAGEEVAAGLFDRPERLCTERKSQYGDDGDDGYDYNASVFLPLMCSSLLASLGRPT